MEAIHLNNPNILIALGDWKLQEKALEEAIEYYTNSVKITPSNQKLFQQLIPLMFENQKPFDDIIEIATLATENFPETSEFWFYLGTAQSGNKDNEGAKNLNHWKRR